jgi:cold shock protein
MGRYKDYREPKRRGYDDDYTPEDREAERRPSNPRPSTPHASEPVEAIVKWFNAEKGFGFIAVVGGSEAFMHIRQLEAAGHSSVPEGARVKVRIGQGQKGPEVTEVIEVDTSTAQTTGRRSVPRSASQRQPGVGPTEECVGSVKWYNADKGFGFVGQDGGGKDVFIHATTLDRGGLSGAGGRSACANANRSRPEGARGSVNRAPGLNDHFNRRGAYPLTEVFFSNRISSSVAQSQDERPHQHRQRDVRRLPPTQDCPDDIRRQQGHP